MCMEGFVYKMFSLEKSYWKDAYQVYETQGFFFPIIACVLLGQQKGRVFVDKFPNFSQFYVEHHFGFAQIFGKNNFQFEDELREYFFINRNFSVEKIRLYDPLNHVFLKTDYQNSLCSSRQRLIFSDETHLLDYAVREHICFLQLRTEYIEMIESNFGLVRRFWSGDDDFLHHSRAVVLLYKGLPASICYAAAKANNLVELDILTLEKFRNLGLGKAVAAAFIDQCREEQINISWDCFSNNLNSKSLAKSLGFKIIHESYPFYTINR